MKRVSVLGLVVVCALALGAVMATTAEAEGPFWRLCVKGGTGEGKLFEDNECSKENAAGPWRGERLKAGVAKGLITKIKSGTFKITNGTIAIECTGLNLKETKTITGGVSWSRINGTEPGTAGSSAEIIEFTGCTVTGNGEKCEVEGKTITTNELTNTLDKTNEKPTKGEKLLVSFKPTTGLLFVTIKFKAAAGGKCTAPEATVETGKEKLGVAAVVETETAPKSGKLEPVRLEENEKLAFKGALTFPTTLLKEEWIEEGKAVKKVEEELTFAGKKVKEFTGAAIIELKEEAVAKETFGVFGK